MHLGKSMTKRNVQRRWALEFGDPSLDFVNTRWNRRTGEPMETLHRADDVLHWLRLKRLIDARTHRCWLERLRRSPSTARRLLSNTIKLREALYRVFWSIANHRPPARNDVAVINRALAAGRVSPVLSMRRGRLDVVYRRDVDGVASLAAPVATAAVQVLSDQEAAQLRRCLNAQCAAVFVDRTKNRSRRWCHMMVCGSVFKMRRYRRTRRRS